MANDGDKDRGILNSLKDAAKWWLGDGAAAGAAEDVDSRTRRRRMDCAMNGGRWDPETNSCVMPEDG